MKKKVLSTILASVLSLSLLCACGQQGGPINSKDKNKDDDEDIEEFFDDEDDDGDEDEASAQVETEGDATAAADDDTTSDPFGGDDNTPDTDAGVTELPKEGVITFKDNLIYQDEFIKVTLDDIDTAQGQDKINATVDSTIDYRQKFTIDMEIVAVNGIVVNHNHGSGPVSSSRVTVSGTVTENKNLGNLSNFTSSEKYKAFVDEKTPISSITVGYYTLMAENDADDPFKGQVGNYVFKTLDVARVNAKEIDFGSEKLAQEYTFPNVTGYEAKNNRIDQASGGNYSFGLKVCVKEVDGVLYFANQTKITNGFQLIKVVNGQPGYRLCPYKFMRYNLYIDGEKVQSSEAIGLYDGAVEISSYKIQDFKDEKHIPDTQKVNVELEYYYEDATFPNSQAIFNKFTVGEF